MMLFNVLQASHRRILILRNNRKPARKILLISCPCEARYSPAFLSCQGSFLSWHFPLSGLCYWSSENCCGALTVSPLIRRERSWRDKKILCPQVRHSRPMSAPIRTTFHSRPPQGCALRRVTRSFTSMFSILTIIKQILPASDYFINRSTRGQRVDAACSVDSFWVNENRSLRLKLNKSALH